MKTTVFTLTTMGLGLMAGVTAMHHYQVKEMVSRGGAALFDKPEVNSQVATVQVPDPAQSPAKLAVSDVAEPVSATSYSPPRTAREDALLELLAEMRKEQKTMYKQMAEQNRELAELTFRVDTHSDSFKPLRTDSNRPHSLNNPLNPTTQIPISDDDSLLPPKPSRVESP